MRESMSPSEEYKNWTAPKKSKEVSGGVSGEMGGEQKGLSKFESKTEEMAVELSSKIESVLVDRKVGMATAEANSVFYNELLPAVRDKTFGGEEIKNIMKKMGDEPYLETGKTVVLPLDTGEQAKFDLVVMAPNRERKLKFGLIPSKGDALASQIAMS